MLDYTTASVLYREPFGHQYDLLRRLDPSQPTLNIYVRLVGTNLSQTHAVAWTDGVLDEAAKARVA